MTWQHVILISLAMGLVVACGFQHTCSEQMQVVGDISKMVIAGALGNAFGHVKRKEPT